MTNYLLYAGNRLYASGLRLISRTRNCLMIPFFVVASMSGCNTVKKTIVQKNVESSYFKLKKKGVLNLQVDSTLQLLVALSKGKSEYMRKSDWVTKKGWISSNPVGGITPADLLITDEKFDSLSSEMFLDFERDHITYGDFIAKAENFHILSNTLKKKLDTVSTLCNKLHQAAVNERDSIYNMLDISIKSVDYLSSDSLEVFVDIKCKYDLNIDKLSFELTHTEFYNFGIPFSVPSFRSSTSAKKVIYREDYVSTSESYKKEYNFLSTASDQELKKYELTNVHIYYSDTSFAPQLYNHTAALGECKYFWLEDNADELMALQESYNTSATEYKIIVKEQYPYVSKVEKFPVLDSVKVMSMFKELMLDVLGKPEAEK